MGGQAYYQMITYRPITAYKYQLMAFYTHETGWAIKEACKTRLLSLSTDGKLKIAKNYCWDGPSGLSIDTKNFMRGSLVHDAVYQLMRAGQLSLAHRENADQLLRDICLEDGMSSFRAWYVYQAVHCFAEGSAKPQPEPREIRFEAP